MQRQADFFKGFREFAPNRISYGDESDIGRRKISRPFERNRAMHVVLKSDIAQGKLSLLTPRNQVAVDQIVATQAMKFDIKIHSWQNVGNHIHMLLSSGRKENFKNFLRVVAGLIARFVLGGNGKFWTKPPFSRLVSGRRDFLKMLNYIAKNLVEATLGKSAREEMEAREAAERRQRRRTKAQLKPQK